MSDYKKALQEGFEAAKLADSARKEIAGVLAAFEEQVLEGSEGRISVELKMLQEQRDLTDLYTMQNIFGKLPPTKTYEALVASNPKVAESRTYQLARWKQARDGYPCELSYNQKDMQMHDRVSLENGLAELLRDSRVGEMLYKLINLE
jgi:hypothetical protein